ncbi:MAG TPA: SHOCT domain-containing protein [Microthrixaceae bacterium]|nr:SHOCT domain-containing protein [Microthrixaceae bacterium]
MPGLLRGVARTAVIAGTASAVNGRVQRRQAEKYASRDAQIYADRQQAYQESTAPQPEPAPNRPDSIEQLRQLGELHTQGVLTDEEFAAQKAKVLNS